MIGGAVTPPVPKKCCVNENEDPSMDGTNANVVEIQAAVKPVKKGLALVIMHLNNY